MKLREYKVLMNGHLKPFVLPLYKGSKVLGFWDNTGNPEVKLHVLEEFGDEFEQRSFCFYQIDGETEVPKGAQYIATCRGTYWTPFMLFEVTNCEIEEES